MTSHFRSSRVSSVNGVSLASSATDLMADGP